MAPSLVVFIIELELRAAHSYSPSPRVGAVDPLSAAQRASNFPAEPVLSVRPCVLSSGFEGGLERPLPDPGCGRGRGLLSIRSVASSSASASACRCRPYSSGARSEGRTSG